MLVVALSVIGYLVGELDILARAAKIPLEICARPPCSTAMPDTPTRSPVFLLIPMCALALMIIEIVAYFLWTEQPETSCLLTGFSVGIIGAYLCSRLLLRFALASTPSGTDTTTTSILAGDAISHAFGNIHNHVICVLSADGHMIQCYGHARSIFSQDKRTIIGQMFSHLVPDYPKNIDRIRADGSCVIPIPHQDGSVFLAEICLCSAPTYDGSILLLRDLTADLNVHAELQEHARELRTAFDTISDALFLMNLDGSIRDSNQAARDLYGNATHDTQLSSFIRRADEPSIEDSIQRCIAFFKPVKTEQYLSQHNKTVLIHIFPILDAQHHMRQLLCIERDISHERLMELEVRLQHKKLQENNRRLRELDIAKTQWLNSVSHELRTPLTSIRSFSELLLTYDDTDSATQEEFLGIIISESERLGRLIDELLDLARIESGSMSWNATHTDMVSIAHDCRKSLTSIAEKNNISIDIICNQKTVSIHSDRDRMLQVFVNLISNALKFSPHSGTIVVSIDADDEDVRVSIEDDGPGIPAADRQSIFERFSQGAHQLSNKPQGTGLGLTITQHIITYMGGHILVVDPVSLSGAHILFSIPRQSQSDAFASFSWAHAPSTHPAPTAL